MTNAQEPTMMMVTTMQPSSSKLVPQTQTQTPLPLTQTDEHNNLQHMSNQTTTQHNYQEAATMMMKLMTMITQTPPTMMMTVMVLTLTPTNTILTPDTLNQMNDLSQTTAITNWPMILSNLLHMQTMNMMVPPMFTQPFCHHLETLENFHSHLVKLCQSIIQCTLMLQTMMPTLMTLAVPMPMMITLLTTNLLTLKMEQTTDQSTPALPAA